MRFLGNLVAPTGVEKTWAVEVSVLGIFTQGETREEALAMIKEAVELASEIEVKVEAEEDSAAFTIAAAKDGDALALLTFMFRQNRMASELTAREAAQKMGSSSPNAYARYEQGAVPRLETLDELFSIRNGEAVLGFIEKRKVR